MPENNLYDISEWNQTEQVPQKFLNFQSLGPLEILMI